MIRIGTLLLAFCLLLPSVVVAKAQDDMKVANESVVRALQAAQKGDLVSAKKEYDSYSSRWFDIEDGVKKKSKAAYQAIEDGMGQVTYAFTKQPVPQADVITGLQKLSELNDHFINGDLAFFGVGKSGLDYPITISDLVALLDQALVDLQNRDGQLAKEKVDQFRQSWLDIEGIVLTQSNKVYTDMERDMVASYAQLSQNPPELEGAQKTIQNMRDALVPLAGKSTYTMLDAVTILLREGLEALLVIVALLSFLMKSGNADKQRWIWYGVGSGLLVSVILGVIVQLLFSSGAFGNNNFLIAGITGLFAGVMLLYMSYWLHSKSSISSWQAYIKNQSTKALATGSLLSLSILAFLAVFREGTETVLFFIGMASSIDLWSLLGGIGIGSMILIVLSYLILKLGVKIPIRPFFFVSSLLVFYLCFKFIGMGINGLQLAGVVPATKVEGIGSISSLAIYPTFESLVPQVLLLLAAVITLWLGWRRDHHH